MLRMGGGQLSVAGFHRGSMSSVWFGGLAPVDFGRTFNGGFLQRLRSVFSVALRIKEYERIFSTADIILARNLEMLALAVWGRFKNRSQAIIIYEMLDIHRLLLGPRVMNKLLRFVERSLLRRAAAIITSSPAYIRHYFNKINATKLPIYIAENKLLGATAPTPSPVRSVTAPWVIGWFGILRCRKSLDILVDAVRHSDGGLKVIIRGKPALDQIPHFHRLIDATPGIQYLGSYIAPDDLATIYGEVHFAWAIDFYEEGQNSAWLLPNRLYEGSYYGALPIALEGTETARFIEQYKTGVVLAQPLHRALDQQIAPLSENAYNELKHSLNKQPMSTWAVTKDDCVALVDFMNSFRRSATVHNA